MGLILIKVAIIEDHSLVLESLKKLLATIEDIEVVGVATDGSSGLEIVDKQKPDVLVLDVRLPDVPASKVISSIRNTSPDTRVLCLSSFDSIYEISEVLFEGASGYLLKQASADEFISAIRSVNNNGMVLDPNITRKLMDYKQLDDGNDRDAAPLTKREKEILELISKGLSNKQIATNLSISEDTVKTHISRMFSKLDVHNRVEAVASGIRLGILKIE